MSRVSPSLAAALTVLAVLSALLAVSVPRRMDALAPLLDAPVERAIRDEAIHSYGISLSPGEFLQLEVDQRGVDVLASLADPAGREILAIDSPNGDRGPEPLAVIARRPGTHVLAIRALQAGDAGRYAVRIVARRPATGTDRDRAEAARLYTIGEYRAALGIWRRLGDLSQEIVALRRIAEADFALADLRSARDHRAQALDLCRRLGDARQEAAVLLDLGVAQRLLGDLPGAEASYEQALRITRELGDRSEEARALNNLGKLYDSLSEPQKALDAYEKALALWRGLGDRSREAAALHNLATVHSLMGRLPEALDLLGQALALRRAAQDSRGEAAILMTLGWVHTLAGEPQRAMPLYDEAVRRYRGLGDLRGEAAVLDRRGTALARLGRLPEAMASYRRALAIFHSIGEPGSEAHTLANVGWIHDALGDPRAALACQVRALALFSRLGDRHAEAETLVAVARAERRRGRLDLARSRIEEALRLLEALRVEPRSPELRTSYVAFRYDFFELAIDLLMDLHRRDPQGSFDARAFEISERARARSLMEEIAGARSRQRPGADGRAAPEPLRLEAVQRLLDPDTLLLEIALGEPASFLWLVGRDELVSRRLPGRAALEAQARRVRDLLPRSARRGVRRQADLEAAALGRTLLGPVAGQLGGGRLVIVADGALLGVPFAALPVLAGPAAGRPLLADHEVVQLPSASLLGLLRRELEIRRPPPHTLAVVADPVFAADDPRLQRGGTRLAALERLPFAGREADDLLRRVPAADRLAALGFAASRETVLGGKLADYRIVHFATHAFIDAEHPELSGLALSRFDPAGRPRDGDLHAWEIYGLDLPADLVVLSACRTALGRHVPGEGLMGLTRAFLHAGAARVLVSLWNVNDQATAELMGLFYRNLLERGLPAGSALREAQLALRSDPRWEAPYYWAGFTLRGDWR